MVWFAFVSCAISDYQRADGFRVNDFPAQPFGQDIPRKSNGSLCVLWGYTGHRTMHGPVKFGDLTTFNYIILFLTGFAILPTEKDTYFVVQSSIDI